MLKRFAARIPIATCGALSRVHHVLRAVPGLASIKALVGCRVRPLVSASRATYAALGASHAVTSALPFVANHVRQNTVIRVAQELINVWTSSR